MHIAMIGLGKMGLNMVVRLLKGGHTVVAMDRDAAQVAKAKEAGAIAAADVDDVIAAIAVKTHRGGTDDGACGHRKTCESLHQPAGAVDTLLSQSLLFGLIQSALGNTLSGQMYHGVQATGPLWRRERTRRGISAHGTFNVVTTPQKWNNFVAGDRQQRSQLCADETMAAGHPHPQSLPLGDHRSEGRTGFRVFGGCRGGGETDA